MAIVKYGALITEIKGKVGGQVFQNGNAGFVLRNKNSRPGAASISRLAATNGMSAISSSWRLLTDAQRLAWAAATENWLFLNRYGETYEGSGYQMFCAYNRRLALAEQSTVLVPGVPGVAPDPVSIEADFSANNMAVAWDTNPGANGIFLVYASKMPPSQKAFGRPYYFMGYQLGESGDLDIADEWRSRFGHEIVGYNINVRITSCNILFPKVEYNYEISQIVS